jgi:cell division initiation protein
MLHEGSMRITSLDIHEQTFRMAFRGFDPVEVDAFLQRLADELERLTEERDGLRVELEEERKRRNTLEDAIAAARALQESIIESAREEAEVLRNQGQLRADRILAEANEELLQLRREIQALRERRSLWLADLAALARTLGGWAEDKAVEEVETPDLIAEPADAVDPGDEAAPDPGDDDAV